MKNPVTPSGIETLTFLLDTITNQFSIHLNSLGRENNLASLVLHKTWGEKKLN
jgi:hypothetical protein